MKRALYNAGAIVVVASAAFLGSGGALVRSINNVIAGALSLQTKTLSQNEGIQAGLEVLSGLQTPTAYAEVADGGGDGGGGGGSCGGSCGSCCC